VSADGSTALIGDHEYFHKGGYFHPHDGAAWVFARSGSTWQLQAKLAGAVGSSTGFGHHMALSADGSTALIAGYKATWVFTRSGSTWTQQGEPLTVPQAEYNTGVGLTSDGNTAVISARGAGWVFIRSGSTWTLQSQALTVGTSKLAGGVAFTSDGDTVLIGGDTESGEAAGWVFTRSGSGWSEQAELPLGWPSIPGRYGDNVSVALSGSGDTALIGATECGGEYHQTCRGRAYSFIYSLGSWSAPGDQLTNGSREESENQIFGSSVALSANGSVGLIGQDSFDPYSIYKAGAAFMMERNGAVWGVRERLRAPATKRPNQGDLFGVDVALSADGSTALVGAPAHKRAYVFG
jgi:hypothetical protein